jgi:hypothetical protein
MLFVPMLAIIAIGAVYILVARGTYYKGESSLVDICTVPAFLSTFIAEAVCFVNYKLSLITMATTIVYGFVAFMIAAASPHERNCRETDKTSGNRVDKK